MAAEEAVVAVGSKGSTVSAWLALSKEPCSADCLGWPVAVEATATGCWTRRWPRTGSTAIGPCAGPASRHGQAATWFAASAASHARIWRVCRVSASPSSILSSVSTRVAIGLAIGLEPGVGMAEVKSSGLVAVRVVGQVELEEGWVGVE